MGDKPKVKSVLLIYVNESLIGPVLKGNNS